MVAIANKGSAMESLITKACGARSMTHHTHTVIIYDLTKGEPIKRRNRKKADDAADQSADAEE